MNPYFLDNAYIFRSPEYAQGLYDSFFGGLYFALGAPMMAQVVLLVSFGLAILCWVLFAVDPRPRWRHLTVIFGLLSFSLICFFLTQPWDELFVNLRHAFHVKEVGRFSFNRLSPIEGTVDFLPYYLIGWLAKLGFPIVELSFLQSGIGGVLCIGAACSILSRMGFRLAWGAAFLFFCVYAPLALNAANGFAATTFTACILWGLYFLFFTPKVKLGWFVLSLVPMIRMEGIFLLSLVWIYYHWRVKSFRSRGAWVSAAAFLPAMGLSVWRIYEFGHMIPVPIRYKSTTAGFFFVMVGIRNFFADLINGYGLAALTLAVPCLVLSRRQELRLEREGDPVRVSVLYELLVVLAIFVATYYVSGGDWLPRYWGRYFLPLSLFSVIVAWVAGARVLPAAPEKTRWLLAGTTLGVFLLQAPWYFSAYRKMADDIFTHKKVMANIFSKLSGPRHHRIHHLSQLGIHLKHSTSPQAVIASSEIATIMYFAERETLDLLGVANPEVVQQPPRVPPALVRSFPLESELPYLIFRRVNPGLIAKHSPDIVYTFDFFPGSLMEEVPFEELSNEKLLLTLQRWEYKYRGLNGPLYGGIGSLMELGYRPVIVLYANRFCTMYFVSPKAKEDHFARLAALGFQGGEYRLKKAIETHLGEMK